ncbi:hypothetical protein D3C72_2283240 [compost metagenome]
MRINARQRGMSGGDFRLTNCRVAVQRLAMQIGYRHGVEIQQRHTPDARRREILRRRTAQTT